MVVTVDDEPPTQSCLQPGRAFRFTFRHKGQHVHGTVMQDEGIFPGRIKYSLAIDGNYVDTGMVPIVNWPLGVVAIVLVTAMLALSIVAFIYYEVDKIIDAWIESQL